MTLGDLRGLMRLGFEATIGVTDLVAQMHRTIGDWSPPLGRARVARTRGITGTVYRSIRGTTRLLARTTDASLRLLEPFGDEAPLSPQREAALAIINGAWGDHLESSGNALAIPMAFRLDGRRFELTATALRRALPDASGKIAVLVHGLCMNDLQWRRAGHHHGAMLAREFDYTVLAVHYNSGLHVSDNGERFAAMLEELVGNWPRQIEELVLVGHSMGAPCSQCLSSRRTLEARLAGALDSARLTRHTSPRRDARARRAPDRLAVRSEPLCGAICATGQGSQRRHHRSALRQSPAQRLAGPATA